MATFYITMCNAMLGRLRKFSEGIYFLNVLIHFLNKKVSVDLEGTFTMFRALRPYL